MTHPLGGDGHRLDGCRHLDRSRSEGDGGATAWPDAAAPGWAPQTPCRQLGQAGVGRGRCEAAACRRTNAWGPCRASQGVAGVPRALLMSQGAGWCPKGLAGWVKDTQQRVEDRPAFTLNTSISSSMSSSVSMSSRGSTMTFCTVPRSARYHGAQALSATPGHLHPPLLGRGSLLGMGGGRIPPSPSPSLSCCSGRLCLRCGVPAEVTACA